MDRAHVWLLVISVLGCGGSTSEGETHVHDVGNGDGTTPADSQALPDSLLSDSQVADSASSPETGSPDVSGPEVSAMGCITEIAAGTKVFSCDGLKYDVTVPPACVAGGCGLILDVHGATMSGKMEDNNTNLRALGIKYGYVVVQPSANPSPPSSSWTPASDDTKVYAFLGAALTSYAVDRNRVHMTGFSQGGMMTSRFLCRHADVFASVAPAAGTGCTFKGSDTPSREVPVLYIHGETDALVAYSQGTAQRDAAVAAWKLGPETTVTGDASHKWTRRTSPSGTVFEFISHKYEASSFVLKGHCYPGSKDLKGGEPGQLFGFGCEGATAMVWGEEVMRFFRDHPRK